MQGIGSIRATDSGAAVSVAKMTLLTDAKKAVRLVRRAARRRRVIESVEREFRALPPLERGRYRIAVYFADRAVNAYQIRQWYAPLVELGERHPILVLARSASGARMLLEDGALPVTYVPTITSVEETLDEQDVRIVLYVNQNRRNFQMFRYGHRWHVFINHGESDKAYMVSSQHKAYDYAFVAGRAARDRLASTLWDYDVDRRTFEIGRPQTDHMTGNPPYERDHRTVVLYAPTWEGDRRSMSYGSVVTHGEALVKRLVADPRYRLVYRAHPRTGVLDPDYLAAHERIVDAIAEANRADPTAHHVHDVDPEMGWQLTSADVAISDVSAMVYDRLATGKPLLVTRPADPDAVIDERGYLSACEWLTVEAAQQVEREISRVQEDPDTTARLQWWVEHHFGDARPGEPTARFHAAIEELMSQ